MSNISTNISFPTDDGFWGRECKACEKYFKIHIESLTDKLYCPYCGNQFNNEELYTPEQNKAIEQIAGDIAKAYIEEEFDKMFRNISRKSKFWKYKPGRKTKVREISKHVEKDVDSKIKCTNCESSFHVFGIFGYCPICRDENLLLYEENFKIIQKEILESKNPNRQLRHAYNDLVTAFENFARQYALKYNLPSNTNFQNLKNTRKVFKKIGIDIFHKISETEKLTIRRCFSKRHAQHQGGIVTEQYIKEIPEDDKLLNEKVTLSNEELEEGVRVLRKMVDQILARTA